MNDSQRTHGGLLWGLGAYLWWGGMPLYFWAVQHVRSREILAHRIVWCALILAGLLTAMGHWSVVRRGMASPRTLGVLGLCSVLLAVNWFVYIYAAQTGRVMHGSLGYFMLPLLNVIAGLAIFGERLRPAQALAVLLALAGVLYLLRDVSEFPWISVTLAVSFTIYGVLRKVTPVDGLAGLFIETLFLAPLATGFVLWWWSQGEGSFRMVSWQTDLLLMAAGLVTAVPLLCFGQAARRLPLTTMGFLQYLSPSLQFLLAWLWFGEAFTPEKQVTFGLIWAALAIVTVDSLLARQARLRAAATPGEADVPSPLDPDPAVEPTGR